MWCDGDEVLFVEGDAHHGHGVGTFEGVQGGLLRVRCGCGDTVFTGVERVRPLP